jgi:hypothetical protein
MQENDSAKSDVAEFTCKSYPARPLAQPETEARACPPPSGGCVTV